MAGFRGCIDEGEAAGLLDPDVAKRARDTYDAARTAAGEALGPDEADRVGAKAAMDDLEREAVEAQRRRTLAVRARRSLVQGIADLKSKRGYGAVEAFGGGDGPPLKDGFAQGGEPPRSGPHKGGGWAARALEFIVENKPGMAGAPFPSIEGRYRSLRGTTDAMMADLIERFETRLGFDTPHRAELTNVVREAFGEDTGDASAKMLAGAWSQTAEYLRKAFNAAGGSIARLDKWGMPQAHDAVTVREAGKDAWNQFVRPLLNAERMTDGTTGLPMNEGQLVAALGQVWESIASLGANARQPGEHLGKGALAKRRADPRFLVFNDADAWLAYAKRFGDGDPFASMMGHLDELARDTAQMQILGPNPAAQWDWLRQFAMREALLEEAQGVKGASDRAKGFVQTAENMMEMFTGTTSTPVNTRLAAVGVTLRSALTGFTLGSAILSDLPTSPYFGAMARSFSGLSMKGDMGQLLTLLNPADGSARKTARRSGFIIEQATDGFVRATHDNLRLMSVGERNDAGMNAFARRLPVAIMRAQGLTAYTSARKRSFRFEFMGALHDRRAKTIAQLAAGDAEDQAFAGWLQARGFNEADWLTIRSTPAWEPSSGAAFLRPSDVADQTLAMRLAEGIEMETRFAVPETSLWTRAKLLGRDRPGTFWGEAKRSWAMFRSFSLTATHLYAEELAMRGVRDTAGMTFAVTSSYVAGLVVFLTIGGAVNIQLREIMKGNNPQRMDRASFWSRAMLQGGGIGIMADFLFAAETRNGAGASQVSAFGPPGAFVGDVWNATGGQVTDVAAGMDRGKDFGQAVEGARIGRDVTTVARRYSPFSSLWWTRAVWSRGVVDQIQRLVDPDAEKAFAQRAKRLEREHGSTQWWSEGDLLPHSAPDLSTAFGEPAEPQVAQPLPY